MTTNTASDLVEGHIRGFLLIGEFTIGTASTKRVYPETTVPTMLTLFHDVSDPANVRGRFPLGMKGNRHLPVFPFTLLEDAVFSAEPVGTKLEVGEYIRFTPSVEEDFEHGSDEGLTFEFRVQGYGEYKLWMPLDGLTDFVTRAAPSAKMELSSAALKNWLEAATE